MARALPVVLAAVAYVAAAFAWMARDERMRSRSLPDWSSLDVSERGLSLARAWLAASRPGRRVAPLTTSLRHADVPPEAVVLRIAPERSRFETFLEDAMRDAQEERDARRDRDRGTDRTGEDGKKGTGDGEDARDQAGSDPDTEEALRQLGPPPLLGPAERDWIAAGGRLVVGVTAPRSLRDLDVVDAPRAKEAKDAKEAKGAKAEPVRVHPGWPQVRRLEPETARGLSGAALSSGHAIFAIGERPVLHVIPLGRGDLVLTSCPDVWRNDRLGLADHLALLDAVAGDRPVLFDEAVHGMVVRPGMLELLGRWGLAPALLLVTAAAVASAWRRAGSIGPRADARAASRTDAVDLVDSLALLYRRCLSPRDLLALYHAELERLLVARGLRGRALRDRLETLTGAADAAALPPSPSPAEVAAWMRRLNDAFEGSCRERTR